MHAVRGLYVFITSAFVNAAQARPFEDERCKFTPTSRDWPSGADWAAFNGSVDGRLILPTAPAAACHPGQPEYDLQACTHVRNRWNNSQYHADDPVSNDWQNYNNYSCLPDGKSPCTTDGYPAYVVDVGDARHVQIAVNFARERNLRVNIKSTGHDFLGRYCELPVPTLCITADDID
jgi:hypothetical protein